MMSFVSFISFASLYIQKKFHFLMKLKKLMQLDHFPFVQLFTVFPTVSMITGTSR